MGFPATLRHQLVIVLGLWLAAVDVEDPQFSFCVGAKPILYTEIPPNFDRLEKLDSITSEEFLRDYLSKGKPVAFKQVTNNWPEPIVPNPEPGKPSHRFWNIDHLSSLYPTHFEDENAIIVCEGAEFKDIVPKQHKFPPFLKYNGIDPEVNVEFLFPTINKPKSPNGKHVDTGCLNSYAIQLQGTKLWLLWPPPESEFASSRHKRDLKPVGVILEPGDLLVFYPGWLHETHVIHHPSLSMSIYWDHAIAKFRPTEFYENHAADILRAYPEEYCSCASEWRLSSDHDGAQVCWYNKLQTLYSYGLVIFIMASTIAFVLISGVLVSMFLKKHCPQSDDRNRDD